TTLIRVPGGGPGSMIVTVFEITRTLPSAVSAANTIVSPGRASAGTETGCSSVPRSEVTAVATTAMAPPGGPMPRFTSVLPGRPMAVSITPAPGPAASGAASRLGPA